MSEIKKIGDGELGKVVGGSTSPFVLSNEHRKNVETTINNIKCYYCGKKFNYEERNGIQWYSDVYPLDHIDLKKYIFAIVKCPYCNKRFSNYKDGYQTGCDGLAGKDLDVIYRDF